MDSFTIASMLGTVNVHNEVLIIFKHLFYSPLRANKSKEKKTIDIEAWLNTNLLIKTIALNFEHT